VRVDGEALVMHAGDKPYVVSPTGQVDLASRGLTLDAVDGIVKQLLSPESHGALDEFGAVQYELPPIAEFPGEHFTVVAARGGDGGSWTSPRVRRNRAWSRRRRRIGVIRYQTRGGSQRRRRRDSTCRHRHPPRQKRPRQRRRHQSPPLRSL